METDLKTRKVGRTKRSAVPAQLLCHGRSFDYIETDPVDGERVFLDSASGSLRLKAATDALARHSRWPDQVGRLGGGSGLVAEAIERGTEDVRLLLAGERASLCPH